MTTPVSRVVLVVLVAAAAAIVALFAATFRSARPGPDVSVRFLSGDVFVGGRPFAGSVLRQGAIVRTGPAAALALDLGHIASLDYGANTECTVPVEGRDGGYACSITRGTVLVANVTAPAQAARSPRAVVDADSGATFAIECDGESTRVCVLAGGVRVRSKAIAPETCAVFRRGGRRAGASVPDSLQAALLALHSTARLH